MKKTFYFLLVLVAIVTLTACNSEEEVKEPNQKQTVETPDNDTTLTENQAQEDTANADSKKENPVKEDVTTEEQVQQDSNQDDGTKEEVVKEDPAEAPKQSGLDKEESKVYENEAFKNVVVKETDDKIMLTGKARVFEGVFQYELSEGGKVLLEDRYQTEGAPAWGDFTIKFEKDLLSGDKAVMKLFVYSAKDSSEIDLLEIPIQK